MAFKLALFSCMVVVSSALIVPAPQVSYAAPVAKVLAPAEDYDPHPRYSYAYDVQDTLTGDSKSQQETRDGDVVQGSYSVLDPDGMKRTVEYTSDPQNGFNAVVHKEPIAAVAKVATSYALPGVPAYAAAPQYAPAPAYSVAPAYAPAPEYSVAPAYAPAYAATPVVHAAPIAKLTAPIGYSTPFYQH